MKKQFILLFGIIFLCSCSAYYRYPRSSKWQDKTGKSISEDEFQTKWRDPLLNSARWDYVDSTKTRKSVLIPRVQRGTVDYEKLSQYLSSKTNQDREKNTTILLQFNYLHDFCGGMVPYQKVSESVLNKWKKKSKKYDYSLERNHPNMLYLSFFEKNMLDKDLEGASYFSDVQNILKKSIFKQPAFCGSYALIKPNGQMLIINGEGRPDYIADRYLNPQKWEQYFPVEEE